MKRSASSLPAIERATKRKSARIAKKYPQLKKVNISGDYSHGDLKLWRAQDICDTYNTFIPFAGHYSQNHGRELRLRGVEIAETVREIEEIVESTRKALEEKYQKLRNGTEGFIFETICSHPYHEAN